VVDTDETPRRETTEAVQAAPGVPEGRQVTAGNAPGLNDGAAAVVVSSRAKAEQLGVKPLARILSYGNMALEPRYLFAAPAKTIPVVLKRAGWTLQDVDLIELNEAFAAQALANGYELADQGWDWKKVNVNGGAIAPVIPSVQRGAL
jgi:acetyl-CoA C-acetyltransferase